MAARYYRPLERSVSVACPFRFTPALCRDEAPVAGLFAETVEIDANLWNSHRGLALDKTPYLHSQRMPLAEVVALDETEMGADGQQDGFVCLCSSWRRTLGTSFAGSACPRRSGTGRCGACRSS